ncbi:hypothetical protein [Mycobacteroides abscessus]|uniref:hypothetical protein n=1 Tax=Mycobacteroides abscessus TaxID=36809 RepID=UPI0021048B00|nr:hypothetical protein [Mycobacteroides abscessus]
MFSSAFFEPISITPNQLYELSNLAAVYLIAIGISLWGWICVASTVRGIAEVYADKVGEHFGPRDLYVPVAKLVASTALIGLFLHNPWIWRTLRGGNHVDTQWLDRPIGSFRDLVLTVTAGSSQLIAQTMQCIMALGVGVSIGAIIYILNITPASHAWFVAKWSQIWARRTATAKTETVSES